MKTFAIFYEAKRALGVSAKVDKLPKGVERLPDGTYRGKRHDITTSALDPELKILHRIDGPAVTAPWGIEWWLNGERHRIDGPATISPGSEAWWLNGKRHRIGGPAFTQNSKIVTVGVPYSQEMWYQNGQLHRIDGPAVIEPGREEWYVNGQRHRIGGPAVIKSGHEEWFIRPGREEWWVEGVKFTEEDYNNLMKRLLTLTDDSDREATIAAATMFD